jgi:hypothetical protein
VTSELSDGEIWTAHGGVNPCGLVVQRGDRELRTWWLCSCSTQKLWRDTRTRRFYTDSGLRRVKPYIQFFGLYCWHGEITWRPVDGLLVVHGRMPLPTFYWAADKVGGLESRSVTTGKPISSLFTSWKAYSSCLNSSGLPCLVCQAVFTSSGPHVRSGRPTDRSAGLLIGRTHLSGRPWAWSVGAQG